MVKKSNPKKAKSTVRVLEETVVVVGLQHRLTLEARKFMKRIIERDDGLACKIKREPDNEKDPNAVMVIATDRRFKNTHLGYIRKPVNEAFAVALKGKKIKVVSAMLYELDPEAGEAELDLQFKKIPGNRKV